MTSVVNCILQVYNAVRQTQERDAKIKMREKENIHTLILEAVGIEMDGEYVVKAENKVGYVQTSANVCV